jgi:hypothetical protein
LWEEKEQEKQWQMGMKRLGQVAAVGFGLLKWILGWWFPGFEDGDPFWFGERKKISCWVWFVFAFLSPYKMVWFQNAIIVWLFLGALSTSVLTPHLTFSPFF